MQAQWGNRFDALEHISVKWFSTFLRERRGHLKLSPEAFAKKARMDLKVLRRLESGQTMPTFGSLDQIAKSIG
jgi:transcriptional regulator with XRE-family HTH domain